ncbi:MAG: 3'-5' exonuclease [Bacteroidales bacterium]|nr:3'-5' exonuclease [Bacteroidales bacterium]MCF8455113.1 3'-5' exonuclease [Bacteroidales bacterium]
MDLNLKKPLAFFDLETTGINIVSDRIVEISILKVHPNGNQETKTYRVNPTVPIPDKVSKIHGIYDQDVADKPPFKDIAREIAAFLDGCDLAGYNSNMFDVPLLAEEFIRAEVDFDMKKRRLVDVQVIFHKMEQRTLGAAYQFFCGKSLENAHSAEADTTATFEVLKAQLDRYENLQNDMDYLAGFSSHNKNADFAGRIVFNSKGEEIINFGKHKGKKVEEVFEKEPSYYNWMMEGDFPLYTKKVLTSIKLRKFNQK